MYAVSQTEQTAANAVEMRVLVGLTALEYLPCYSGRYRRWPEQGINYRSNSCLGCEAHELETLRAVSA